MLLLCRRRGQELTIETTLPFPRGLPSSVKRHQSVFQFGRKISIPGQENSGILVQQVHILLPNYTQKLPSISSVTGIKLPSGSASQSRKGPECSLWLGCGRCPYTAKADFSKGNPAAKS